MGGDFFFEFFMDLILEISANLTILFLGLSLLNFIILL